MTAAPVMHVLELLEARGCNPRRTGAGHLARCPAHEDQQASLSVGKGDDGRVLLKCHAGCEVGAICSSLGLQAHELFPPRECKARRPRQPMDGAALWPKLAEHDEEGEAYLKSRGLDAAVGMGLVRFNIPRRALADDAERWLDKKSAWRVAVAMRDATGAVRDFQLRAITQQKTTKLSLCGAPRPSATAFGRPDLAAQGGRVFIAEGMADTLALCVSGVVGIGAPGVEKLVGLAELVPAGAEAVLCVQNDREGQSAKGFARLAKTLEKRCVRILWLTTPAPHKDPADWLKAVGMVAFQAALAGEAVHANASAEVNNIRERLDRLAAANEQPAAPHSEPDCTDAGNAAVLSQKHGADLRHVHELGWLHFDDVRWRRDTTGEVMRRARTVCSHWYDRAAEALKRASQGGPDAKNLAELAEALTAWGKQSRSAARLNAMVQLAASEAPLVARVEDLDRDPLLLTTPTGTVDLRTGALRPNNRDDLNTRATAAPCIPGVALRVAHDNSSRVRRNNWRDA